MKKQRGFTLMELLIVLAIVVVFFAIVVPVLSPKPAVQAPVHEPVRSSVPK